MQNTIAIICDCDGTLANDTTEFLLKENGIDIEEFWKNINENFVQKGWDPPQAYLTEILNRMKTGEIKQNTPQKIQEVAREIKPYDGVNTFLTELKQWIANDSECISAGINLEGYIISAGIEDLVRGCSFASQFTDIFAGNYHVNPETHQYDSIKSTVTFTEKTKFLYAINKGIDGKDLRKVPYLVNDIKEEKSRRIPFENMIYIGDGPSDIPCFSAVRSNGGHCIGIMDKHKPKRAYELARGQRTNYGIYSSNYMEGSDLRLMLKSILEEIKRKIIS